jgi:hypothetical protein
VKSHVLITPGTTAIRDRNTNADQVLVFGEE